MNNFDYIADGRISRQENSNGTMTKNTYDSMKMHRLARKFTTKEGTAIQDLNYAYDNVGNILNITDKDKSTTYTYDDLNRLLSATNTGTNPYTHTFSYNALGNITTFNNIPYIYDSTEYANPHAVTKIGNAAYSYDKNGNLLTNGTQTYTWDYKNRLTNITSNNLKTTYAYDYKNQMITTNNGISTTIYPTKYYNEERNKNGKVINTTKHIFDNNGNVVASINGKGLNAKVSYIHTDHLGSTTHITDTAGQITETNEYYPYGSPINQTGLEQRKYIGEEYDRDTGLNYLNARYYDGNRGQFISQDPAFRDLEPMTSRININVRCKST